jgi:uncharacterized membrane protein
MDSIGELRRRGMMAPTQIRHSDTETEKTRRSSQTNTETRTKTKSKVSAKFEQDIVYDVPMSYRFIQGGIGAAFMLLSYALSTLFGDSLYLKGFFIFALLLSISSLIGKAIFIRETNRGLAAYTGLAAFAIGLLVLLSEKGDFLAKLLGRAYNILFETHLISASMFA